MLGDLHFVGLPEGLERELRRVERPQQRCFPPRGLDQFDLFFHLLSGKLARRNTLVDLRLYLGGFPFSLIDASLKRLHCCLT